MSPTTADFPAMLGVVRQAACLCPLASSSVEAQPEACSTWTRRTAPTSPACRGARAAAPAAARRFRVPLGRGARRRPPLAHTVRRRRRRGGGYLRYSSLVRRRPCRGVACGARASYPDPELRHQLLHLQAARHHVEHLIALDLSLAEGPHRPAALEEGERVADRGSLL